MALPCARECVNCALETISIIHQQQNWLNERTVEPLPSWWFEVFFIYTAATALVPARVYKYVRGDILQSDLLRGWQQSLEVLHHLSPLSPSAVSCIAALQVLDDELVFEATEPPSKLPVGALGHDSPSVHRPHAVSTALDSVNTATLMDIRDDQHRQDVDNFDSMLQMQDFTWLDTLPVDVLSGDYTDIPDFWHETW